MNLLNFIRNYDTKKVSKCGYDVVEVFPSKFNHCTNVNELVYPWRDCYIGVESEVIITNRTKSCSYITLGLNKKIGSILINNQIKVLDIEEIREQEDSYLVLKYGKFLLEEVDDV